MKNSNPEATASTASPKTKFTLDASLSIVPVKSGERTSNETVAQISTASQINKFNMNKLAATLMGVVAGDRVKLLVTTSTVLDGKFLLAIADKEDSSAAKLASPTKKEGFGGLGFNYAGVWSQVAQCSADAIEKSGETLVKEEVAIERGSTYYLNQKAIYELQEVENFNEENPFVYGGTSYSKVFVLLNGTTEAVDLSKETSPRKPKADATATSTEEAPANGAGSESAE